MDGGLDNVRRLNKWKNPDLTPTEVSAKNAESQQRRFNEALKDLEKASEIAGDIIEETDAVAEHVDVTAGLAELTAKNVDALELAEDLLSATPDDFYRDPPVWRAIALRYLKLYRAPAND